MSSSEISLNSIPGNLLLIFCDLRILIAVLNRFKYGIEASTNDMMAFSRMRSTVEHRLLSLEERQESVSGQLKLDDYVYDSFVVGIQIYINLVLRNYGPDFALLRTLKRKLMGLLYKHGELSESKSHGSVGIVPLWILLMGGMVALNAEETTSFAQFIAKTMRQSALQGWPEVETNLTQVLWTKHLQRSGFRAL